MKNIRGKSVLTSLATLVSICAISLTVLPAQATTVDSGYAQKLQRMSVITDGHPSVAVLDQQVSQEAVRTGKTKEETLDLAYAAAVAALPSDTVIARRTVSTGDSTLQLAGSGGGTHNRLANAQYAGDIFVANNATAFVTHGHAGIFTSSDWCIEAPGAGQKVRSVNRASTAAAGTAVLQHVNTSATNRNKAVARAKTYIGRPYNSNFITTNRDDKSYMNCGQVVWAAYKYGAGFDIAPNAYYIYPFTIRDSGRTSTYKTVNP